MTLVIRSLGLNRNSPLLKH